MMIQEYDTMNTNSQIKFKTSILKSSLCDYSNAYILVKVTLTFVGKEAYSAITDAYGNNKQVLYKYLAQFIDCIFEITNIKKDYAKDLDVVMLMLMLNLE